MCAEHLNDVIQIPTVYERRKKINEIWNISQKANNQRFRTYL